MREFIDQFAQELQRPAPRLERLALAIAGLGSPAPDATGCLRQLDALAEEMRSDLVDVPAGRPHAERFLAVFTQNFGFTGNQDNYYDPGNSYLNEVLRKRVGLPIMLSLICIALGERLELDVVGIGFPGHFMARYQDALGAWLLDPFHGAVVESTDADQYLSQLFQRPIQLPAEMHQAVSTLALVQRILNNLRNVFLSRGDYSMAASVLDYMLVLSPLNPSLWHERGLLHYYAQQWEYAARDLKRYFFLKGNLPRVLGQEDDQQPQRAVDPQEQQTLDILRQIEETRQRIN
jgi:regulator of sirC expression with transglutaminase-like and TPR domain